MTEGSLKGKEIEERMRKDQQHITLLEKDHKAPFFQNKRGNKKGLQRDVWISMDRIWLHEYKKLKMDIYI